MLSNREMVATKLQRIAEKARRESGCRFTSLFHLMNVEMLRECFRQLRKDAAAGIDKVTKKEYGANLEKFNLFLKKFPLPRPRIMVNLFSLNREVYS